MTKKEFKLSEESAEEQLNLFFEYYDIDISDYPESQIDGINTSLSKLKKGIRKGRVEFKEENGTMEVIQYINEETTLVYGELSGRTKLAMKNKSENDNYGRLFALLGSLSGAGEAAIAKLKGVNLSLAECIGLLFLQI